MRTLLVLVLLAGCSPSTDDGLGSCRLESCAGVCVDGRCVLPDGALDAGDGDAGPRVDLGPPSDMPCAAISSEAEAVRRPADVLLFVDSSSSMGDARARIAAVIDDSFDAILAAEGIDYRVILFADLDVLDLTGALGSYDPPRLFRIHVGSGSGSGANFTRFLNAYATAEPMGSHPNADPVAWGTLLREDAVKIALHFTDATSGDGSTIDGYSGTFDQALYALDSAQFGASAADGKLVYHAFTGIEAKPTNLPYEPSEPLVTGECGGGVRAGAGFQQVALDTGGLRFPLCDYDHYDEVFTRIADDLIDTVAAECTFPLPEPPAGDTLDLDTVAVRYYPAGGSESEVLRQVPDGACDGDSFVIDEVAETLSLCPEACARVQADAAARLEVVFGCDPDLL